MRTGSFLIMLVVVGVVWLGVILLSPHKIVAPYYHGQPPYMSIDVQTVGDVTSIDINTNGNGVPKTSDMLPIIDKFEKDHPELTLTSVSLQGPYQSSTEEGALLLHHPTILAK